MSPFVPITDRIQPLVLVGGDKPAFGMGSRKFMFSGIFFGCHMLEAKTRQGVQAPFFIVSTFCSNTGRNQSPVKVAGDKPTFMMDPR